MMTNANVSLNEMQIWRIIKLDVGSTMRCDAMLVCFLCVADGSKTTGGGDSKGSKLHLSLSFMTFSGSSVLILCTKKLMQHIITSHLMMLVYRHME